MQDRLEALTRELHAKLNETGKAGSWSQAEVVALCRLYEAVLRALTDNRVLQHFCTK